MAEVSQPSTPHRDWQVHCYDTTGQLTTCVIDSDHGAVRVGLTAGEEERFFELRAEQAVQFQAALEATLGTSRDGGSHQAACWEGGCYNKWREPSNCLIEATQQDVVRISCVATGERKWSLQLRKDQIGKFQAALAEAMKVFRIDLATHGEHWANEDEETEVMSPCGIEEADFIQKINEMVAEDAPETIALVAEIGDRVDAMRIGYCLKLPDHAAVIIDGPDHVRGSFSSVERACKILSAGGKIKIRSVSVAEAQKQVKTCGAQI
jgi:hypothetical protein